MVDAFADHRADHAEIVDTVPDVGEQIADRNAAFAPRTEFPHRLHQRARSFAVERQRPLDWQRLAVIPGQAWFRIEDVNGQGTAMHKQEDDPLGLRFKVGRPGRQGIGGGGAVKFGLLGQQTRQTEKPKPAGRFPEHRPPGN